jgi:outer membrane protein insertion porin family
VRVLVWIRPSSALERRTFLVRLLLLAVLLFVGGRPLLASVEADGPEQASDRWEISSIEFEGNNTLPSSELRSVLVTRETPGWFNKFLYNSISQKLGSKNEYYNAVVFAGDLDRLAKYYKNRGFLAVRIDTQFVFSPDGSSVDITIDIHEGYRSIIDTLTYRGILDAPETLWKDVRSSPRIAQGDPYNSILLEEEVKRVLRIFNDTGFPNAIFLRDSSAARHFASSGNFSVVLAFSAGKRYRFGPITIEQEQDTLRKNPRRDDITDDIILRQLDYKPGDFYSLANRISSEKNLNQLGVFDLQGIKVAIPPNTDTSIYVPSFITIRPRDKHELAPELIVSNDNSAFNLGAGLAYSNRNFFGGARIFSTSLRFRTQTLREFPDYFVTSSNAIANLDLTFELLQPYIFNNKTKGTWSFSFIIEKQLPYRLNIARNKLGMTQRLAEYTTGFLDWTLEAVDQKLNPNFHGDPNDPDIAEQLRLLSAYPKQLNSILAYTLQRDRTNDVFSPSEGFIHSFTVEEAGILPMLSKNFFKQLPFTQFYMLSALGRWYDDLTTHRYSILAYKLKAALEGKWGESRSDTSRLIPQTYRFYAGGSGSMRGWNSRELIAHADPSLAQLGGNLLLEGSVELRTALLQSLHDDVFDKFWIIQFVDIGNLWPETRDFRFQEIAIDAGLGLRYDTFFGPFRIDWGFRIYNPMEPVGQRWITQRQLFGQTFKEGVFHFGIGHAF